MSYCPEDGTKMVQVDDSVSYACYECPTCGMHWCYDAERGLYSAEADGQREECRSCGKPLITAEQQPEGGRKCTT